MKVLRLAKGEDRRLRAGHLWVFSNEVDVAATPLAGFEPGEPAVVEDSGGRPVGMGYVNPASLISCRLLSKDARQKPDAAFVRGRLERALALRERLFAAPWCRLVNSEADMLPGLVVDRFGDVLAVQANTAGMERLTPLVLEALEGLLAPRGVLLRNDAQSRELEGLPREVRVAAGQVPEDIEVEEGGVRFVAPFRTGQKTGWFYDMRDVRSRAAALAGRLGGAALDAFCYAGALGVRAALAGASRVVCLDASEQALEYAAENARRNGVGSKVETVRGDALETLGSLQRNGFGLVSVDPPAFVKRRRDAGAGGQAYERLNSLASALVADGGFLVSASCSQHFSAEDLRRAVHRGARSSGAWAQIVWQGRQDQDHPVHPAMPETEYLKALCCRLNR